MGLHGKILRDLMSNEKTGSDFEEEFSRIVFSRGFWAHKMTANRHGQPSDVIISKNNMSAMVECKVCENNKFPLSRIEDNQELAMALWMKTGNSHAYFALKINNDIRMIHFITLLRLKEQENLKHLNYKQIMERSVSFDEWVDATWK